jgi:hypothetical protein
MSFLTKRSWVSHQAFTIGDYRRQEFRDEHEVGGLGQIKP